MALCGACVLTYYTAELVYIGSHGQILQFFGLSQSHLWRLNILFQVSNTLGPLIVAVISSKLKPETIIPYNYSLVLTSLVMLYFGRGNLILVYISNVTLAMGFSSILPALLAFAEISLQLNERNVSLYSLLCGFCNLLAFFITKLFIGVSPSLLMVCQTVMILISFAIFIRVKFWIYYKHDDNFDCKKEKGIVENKV